MTNDRHSTILALILAASAILLGLVLLNRFRPQPPVVTPSVQYPSPTMTERTPVVSPTLTTVPQTATATVFTPTESIFVTDTVTATATDNPIVTKTVVIEKPTPTPAWKVVRLCHPRHWWQACYWRCCDGQ